MMSRLSLAGLAMAALSLGIAASCAARTLEVPGEYASIADAIAAAAAGDEVAVAPGSYAENVVVTTGITIRGSGTDRALTTLNAGNPDVAAIIVSLAGVGEARIENLTVAASGSAAGLSVDGAVEGVVKVVGCALDVGSELSGISVQKGSLVVESSVFRGPDVTLQVPVRTCGVLVGAGAAAAIRNCTFAYFADAILTLGGTSLAVESCSVGYSVAGIAVRNQFSDSTTADLAANQIYGCTVGISVSGAVTAVTIQGNTILDCSAAPLRIAAGSCLGGGVGVSFTGVILGSGNVVPQLDLLCPDLGSGFWPEGFFAS